MTRRRWWRGLKWPAMVVLALAGSYLIYTLVAVRKLVIVLPCGYREPFLIAFDAPTGKLLSRVNPWTYSVQIPEGGVANVSGKPPQARSVLIDIPREARRLFMEFQDECTTSEDGRADPEKAWAVEGGTAAEGQVSFDFLCYYIMAQHSRVVCDELVDAVMAQRQLEAGGTHRASPEDRTSAQSRDGG